MREPGYNKLTILVEPLDGSGAFLLEVPKGSFSFEADGGYEAEINYPLGKPPYTHPDVTFEIRPISVNGNLYRLAKLEKGDERLARIRSVLYPATKQELALARALWDRGVNATNDWGSEPLSWDKTEESERQLYIAEAREILSL